MATTITRAIALPPTTQAYHELQLAYDFFQAELFVTDLPPCFITLERKGPATHGYFSPARFAAADGTIADEIGLNPRHFKSSTFIDVMSTLVHEMVHQWQHHFGRRRSRSAYHNTEWAGEMLRIGLHPSDTGMPGGRMIGQAMSHYIVPGGRFEIAAQKLSAMLPALTWFDMGDAQLLPRGLRGSDLTPLAGLSGRRTVYECPACQDRAQGKSTLFIICGKCEAAMQPVARR